MDHTNTSLNNLGVLPLAQGVGQEVSGLRSLEGWTRDSQDVFLSLRTDPVENEDPSFGLRYSRHIERRWPTFHLLGPGWSGRRWPTSRSVKIRTKRKTVTRFPGLCGPDLTEDDDPSRTLCNPKDLDGHGRLTGWTTVQHPSLSRTGTVSDYNDDDVRLLRVTTVTHTMRGDSRVNHGRPKSFPWMC